MIDHSANTDFYRPRKPGGLAKRDKSWMRYSFIP